MERKVLFVPLEEIELHLEKNARQDVKVVMPEILGEVLFERLKASGKAVKPEKPLERDTWCHSESEEANSLCLSADFALALLGEGGAGPFGLSFANERAGQDVHFHRRHIELYYSEHAIGAEYWVVGSSEHLTIELERGGLIAFAPNVVHKVRLGGMTVVLELPCVAGDKEAVEETTCGQDA